MAKKNKIVEKIIVFGEGDYGSRIFEALLDNNAVDLVFPVTRRNGALGITLSGLKRSERININRPELVKYLKEFPDRQDTKKMRNVEMMDLVIRIDIKTNE